MDDHEHPQNKRNRNRQELLAQLRVLVLWRPSSVENRSIVSVLVRLFHRRARWAAQAFNGLTSRSKALRFAIKLQEAADEARARTLTKNALANHQRNCGIGSGGDGLRSFTCANGSTIIARSKRQSSDQHTSAKYDQISREFLAFLGTKADLNILSVTSEDARRFRDQRADELSASTLNDRLTIYRRSSMQPCATTCSRITHAARLKRRVTNIAPSRRRKQPFAVAQVAALLEHASPDWAGLIRVAFYCGARLQDCANLRLRNLDFSTQPPVMVFENYSKHGDEHRVPMHPRCATIWRRVGDHGQNVRQGD